MRIPEAHPEKERPLGCHIKKVRQRLPGLLRVPVELALALGPVVGLAHVAGGVPPLRKQARQQLDPGRQGTVKILGAGGVGIAARQDADSRRTTGGGGQKRPVEHDPRSRQGVEVRRAHMRIPIGAEVRPRSVVGDEDEDVRGLLSLPRRRPPRRNEQQQAQPTRPWRPCRPHRNSLISS